MEGRGAGVRRGMHAAALLAAILAAVSHVPASDPKPAAVPRVLMLGIDGLDPTLLRQFMERGQLPNFQKLAASGDFSDLETVMPPQSPVAWASVVTGQDPGGTGIFDFLHRDPVRMIPEFSGSKTEEPERLLKLGSWILPLDEGKVINLRDGIAFWQVLDAHGIPNTILKMPSNYPPVETEGKSLSGMGTPDIKGTYGIFQLFTDDELLVGKTVNGGEIRGVKLENGRFEAKLSGPDNFMRKGSPPTEVPFTGFVDPEREVVRVDIAGERILLSRGEWSGWVRVEFPLLPLIGTVHGMVRFHLTQAHPRLKLYASPVNLDPTSPAQPLSVPDDYAGEIAEAIGLYYTQGMPEDTQALAAGALDDAGFMSQAAIIREEEDRMVDFAVDRFREGFLFVYYSVIDQVSHVMWRAMDPDHPLWTPSLAAAFGDAIPWTYRAADAALGRVLEKAGPETLVLVISDHGFAPFYREVNLNTWLKDQGYLVLTDDSLESQTQFFNHVDWGRTRAYSVGFNSLYVNRRGRERWGIVDSGPEADALLDEIEAKLLAWEDKLTGQTPVARVYRSAEIYHGIHVGSAPDALIGYRRSYRSSDASALGSLARPLLQDRLDPWTGDHMMEASAVPGCILSNRKLAPGERRLVDIAPTILDAYGIPPAPGMTGRSLLRRAAGAEE